MNQETINGLTPVQVFSLQMSSTGLKGKRSNFLKEDISKRGSVVGLIRKVDIREKEKKIVIRF